MSLGAHLRETGEIGPKFRGHDGRVLTLSPLSLQLDRGMVMRPVLENSEV